MLTSLTEWMGEDVLGWLAPLGFLAGGAILGIFVQFVAIRRLQRFAERTQWQLDNILLAALGFSPVIWFLGLGAYLATFNLPVTLSQRANRTISDTLFVIVALSVTQVASRLAVALFGLFARRIEGVLPSTSIFSNFIRLAVLLLGGLIILQSLGISITPVLTALGVGGLAVALALQDTLSNLFSGFQIIASRQFLPGDYVKLSSGEEGYVRDITWRNTTIEALTAITTVVPNSKLATSIVTNYHQPGLEMSLVIPVSVAYGCDLDEVERITIEVARDIQKTITGGIPEFEPLVRFHTFGESAIQFNAILRIQEFSNQFLIKHEFVKRLHRRYCEENIEIPYPQRVVHLHDASSDRVALRNGSAGK